MCRLVSSKTVSLEKSTYERLRSAKLPGESFTVTVGRLLEGTRPSFRSLAGFWTATDAQRVRSAIRRMRTTEAEAERRRLRELEKVDGGHARH